MCIFCVSFLKNDFVSIPIRSDVDPDTISVMDNTNGTLR